MTNASATPKDEEINNSSAGSSSSRNSNGDSNGTTISNMEWYFAIGSMMLPESCHLRDFYPHESQPAKLLDYELHFFGAFGVAQARHKPGACMHGVLQRVTPEQMKQLDELEVVYIREKAKAIPYGQVEPVDVTVYVRAPPGHPKDLFRKSQNEIDNPPSQRYLDLILAGAKKYNLDQEYIQMLQNYDCIPRTTPHNFRSFDPPPADVVYDELPPDNEVQSYTSVNGKVLELTFPRDSHWYQYTRKTHQRSGRCSELAWAQIFFDIKYGCPTKLEDFTPEHCAYIEDMYYGFLETHQSLQYIKVIGAYGPQLEK